MFKTMPMTIALACVATAADARDGQAALDATWHPPRLQAANPSPQPSDAVGWPDLVPDPEFGTGGSNAYALDDANGKEEWAFRVFPRAGGGWWLTGNHWNGSSGTWDAGIVRVDSNGAGIATYKIATPLASLNDVAFDAATDKLYFAGSATRVGHSDTDMAVTCIDVGAATPAKCSGFGTDGTAYVAFDIASSKNDGAWRVLVRPSLGVLLVGWAQNGASDNAIAAAALYRASGALVTRFGNDGKYWLDFANNDSVQAIALSNDADTEARLYIAGSFEVPSDPGRMAGYVLALNAWTGLPDTSFGTSAGRVTLEPRLKPSGSNDAVSALAVLASGKLAWSGWSLDSGGNRRLIVGRLHGNGTPDNAIHDVGWIMLGALPMEGGLKHERPTDLAERPGNRHLVVAFEVAYEGASTLAGEHRQYAFELDADASLYRGIAMATFPVATGQIPWALPTGLLVTGDAVMMAGTRRWDAGTGDFDYTLARLIRGETIFEDGFEIVPARHIAP